jgi:TetR/AcrR family transcriptional repressor of uid operon
MRISDVPGPVLAAKLQITAGKLRYFDVTVGGTPARSMRSHMPSPARRSDTQQQSTAESSESGRAGYVEEVPSWVVSSRPAPSVRGERTRQRILSSTRTLIKERPYGGISIADIASHSKTSVGTVYRYFENKDSLLIGLLSESLWEMYELSRRSWRADASFLDNTRSTTLAYLRAYRDNGALLKSGSEAALESPQIRALWRDMHNDLHTHMARRLVQNQGASQLKQLDPVITMRALASMVDGYAHRAFAEGEFGPISDDDLEAAADVLSRIWSRTVFGSDNTLVPSGRLAQPESS